MVRNMAGEKSEEGEEERREGRIGGNSGRLGRVRRDDWMCVYILTKYHTVFIYPGIISNCSHTDSSSSHRCVHVTVSGS